MCVGRLCEEPDMVAAGTRREIVPAVDKEGSERDLAMGSDGLGICRTGV